MQFSHSRIECFKKCKHQYKLRYIDGLKTLPCPEHDNALILGSALHDGIAYGKDYGIQKYIDSFPIIYDGHVNEIIKLEYWIDKVRALLPEGKHELLLSTGDFIGYIDLIVEVENGVYDLYEFKYSNHRDTYVTSGQVHLYKYFFEKCFPRKKIRNLHYVMIPKIKSPACQDSIFQTRKEILSDLEQAEIEIVPVNYDSNLVIDFLLDVKGVLENEDFTKSKNYLCRWCEYYDFCERSLDYMLLPKNERRKMDGVTKKVVWLYGMPFSGKTYFANKFPEPLMLNTDGNIKFVDSPYIAIKDIVEVEGRQTKRTLAWKVFKDTIEELEKKENDFKTIIVDLLEDMYEHCRAYMYAKLGITHESDESFSAWDKVRFEFLSTIKRLTNLDYENIILLSHEDRTKDVTKKGGDKITAIKPNLNDKLANKIAGMVDIVGRVIAEDNTRTLSFKENEVVFGGGRLGVKNKEIALDYDEFVSLYQDNMNPSRETERKSRIAKAEPVEVKQVESAETETVDVPEIQEESTVGNTDVKWVNPPDVEEIKPRTRKRRGE